jgi:mono/diheme cytochrome c family protein
MDNKHSGMNLWHLGRALAVGAFAAAVGAVDFAREIEPIFIKRCSECHGPDQQKSRLRLDLKAAAFQGGRSGKPGLVPGQAEESEVFRRVATDDPDDLMPPKGAPLTETEIAALKAWIDGGADWPEAEARQHWSFVKPDRAALPPVNETNWVRTPVDRFLLARLEREDLKPAPEADRPTLIRRLSLDLTGLPPTWSEVQDFVHDPRPDAYERLVDRLLRSPHYGEHLARWWLDLARYADSNGYQVDLARSVWPYRDWVIEAFNRNQPFDQFTIEQIAGDLLPNPSLAQRIATGFNRNTKINDEGGGDAEEYRTKAVKDRVATTATTWLGLTMACAECHTHKYDPISHAEYYQFYAFFNNTADGGNYSVEPTLPVPPPDVTRQVRYLRDRIAEVQQRLGETERELEAQRDAWEHAIAARSDVWVPLRLTHVVSTGGSGYTNLADGSVLATGVNPIYDTIYVEAETELAGITGVLLEVLPDPSLPKNGPGRWGQTGNFILDEFAASATPLAGAAPANTNLFFAGATADWEQLYYRAEHAVDRNPKTGWAIGPRFGERHFLIATLEEPVGFAGGARLGFRFEHDHGNSHTIGRFRISVTTQPDPAALWPVDDDVRALAGTPRAERTAAQTHTLVAAQRKASSRWRALEGELFWLNRRETELAGAKHATLVMKELPQPRETYIHLRGDFLAKGKVVTPGVPEFLPSLPADAPLNRLTLARWMVSPDNPLTARVTVNRLWERFFGIGLVQTSEDFGRQGEAPSHPELLDWLALEFQESGWDMKRLQQLLVRSAAYRQSAAATPALLETDLYNRLLARGPRFRLDPEVIRDQALAVSGLLNPDVGGPSVYPVQIPNLWKEIGFLRPEIGMDEWPTSAGPELYRRGVYTFWRRVCTYPTFATFDAPSREVCTARRPRTNTPLQALAALNEPTFLEAARVFAQRILREGGDQPAEQIEFAFRTCLGRNPLPGERQRLLRLLDEQLRSFEHDVEAAEALLNVGSAERPAGLDPRRLAAWMIVANVLLNLDEALVKG